MKYESCKDYFIYGNTVKLSWSGQDKLITFKITGSKVPLFFEGTKGKNKYIKDSYELWSKIFNFPEVKPENKKKRLEREKNHQFENNVRYYLKKNLGILFSGYPIHTKNIYHLDEIFGGVPDGEEFQENKVTSVLEIKKINNFKESNTLPSYILQLSLYLCLRNLDTGYICVFSPSETQKLENPHNVVFKFPLELQNIECSKQLMNLNSPHLKIKNNENYTYEILQKWVNKDGLILYKVKIDSQKYKFIMESIKNWHTKYSKTGPKMEKNN